MTIRLRPISAFGKKVALALLKSGCPVWYRYDGATIAWVDTPEELEKVPNNVLFRITPLELTADFAMEAAKACPGVVYIQNEKGSLWVYDAEGYFCQWDQKLHRWAKRASFVTDCEKDWYLVIPPRPEVYPVPYIHAHSEASVRNQWELLKDETDEV